MKTVAFLCLLLLAVLAWVGFSWETVYDWGNPVKVGFFQGTPEEWDQFQSKMDAKHSRDGWGFGFSLVDARKEPRVYHVTWRIHGKDRKLRFFGQAWAGDIEIAPGQTIVVDNPILIYPPPGPDGRIPIPPAYISGLTSATISPEEARTQQIREWAASGEICRVLGHMWSEPYKVYDRRSNPEVDFWWKRSCPICGKTETKKEVWE